MMNAEAESKDAQSHAGAKVEGRMMNEDVTQRIVSWGRSGDGSEFARGNRSVDTEGFCTSQMALNSGLRWLRATLCCFRWHGRNSVPDCPRGHPEATLNQAMQKVE